MIHLFMSAEIDGARLMSSAQTPWVKVPQQVLMEHSSTFRKLFHLHSTNQLDPHAMVKTGARVYSSWEEVIYDGKRATERKAVIANNKIVYIHTLILQNTLRPSGAGDKAKYGLTESQTVNDKFPTVWRALLIWLKWVKSIDGSSAQDGRRFIDVRICPKTATQLIRFLKFFGVSQVFLDLVMKQSLVPGYVDLVDGKWSLNWEDEDTTSAVQAPNASRGEEEQNDKLENRGEDEYGGDAVGDKEPEDDKSRKRRRIEARNDEETRKRDFEQEWKEKTGWTVKVE